MIPEDCLVLFQNSDESESKERDQGGFTGWNISLLLPGVTLECCWRSATNFFMAFNRSRKTSTDSLDKSSENIFKFSIESVKNTKTPLPSWLDLPLACLPDIFSTLRPLDRNLSERNDFIDFLLARISTKFSSPLLRSIASSKAFVCYFMILITKIYFIHYTIKY